MCIHSITQTKCAQNKNVTQNILSYLLALNKVAKLLVLICSKKKLCKIKED